LAILNLGKFFKLDTYAIKNLCKKFDCFEMIIPVKQMPGLEVRDKPQNDS